MGKGQSILYLAVRHLNGAQEGVQTVYEVRAGVISCLKLVSRAVDDKRAIVIIHRVVATRKLDILYTHRHRQVLRAQYRVKVKQMQTVQGLLSVLAVYLQ